jgi:hypothetical protein
LHDFKAVFGFSHSLALERTAARRVFTFQMIKTVSAKATLAHLVHVDMAVDLSMGKRSLVRVFASLWSSRSGFEAADQSG